MDAQRQALKAAKLARRLAKEAARDARAALASEVEEIARALPQALAALRSSPEARARAAERLARTPFDPPPAAGEKLLAGGITWTLPPTTEEDGYSAKIRAGWLPIADIARVRRYARGRVMLDIGANIGLTALPRAVIGDFEAVYCAEPVDTTFAALCASVRDNGLEGIVLPQCVAVGDRSASVMMNRLHGVGLPYVTPPNEPPAVDAAPARLVTLDDWIAALGVDPADIAFIKSDAQGYEAHILRGAPRTLAQRHIVWQIEYWPKGLRRQGVDIDEVKTTLEANFSHFVDAKRWKTWGLDPLPITRLRSVLADLDDAPMAFTDLVLLNL